MAARLLPGLTGHFDLRPTQVPTLPRELLDLLWVLQVTHLGQGTTKGCGRIWVEIR